MAVYGLEEDNHIKRVIQRAFVIVKHALIKKNLDLLVKLLYHNGSNYLAALREYHHLKDLRKDLIPRTGLREMIMKFEETGGLGMLPGRGWKPLGIETTRWRLYRLWSTIRNILRYILKWYPYKIHVMQTLKPHDPRTRMEFGCRFLAKMEVDCAWP
ncbi:uncharacterized protein TNCV_1114401 [Trichonephila clavipes]|nr:uncharacterized protein TNCV_1114401 [Trichonephila clavipes]